MNIPDTDLEAHALHGPAGYPLTRKPYDQIALIRAGESADRLMEKHGPDPHMRQISEAAAEALSDADYERKRVHYALVGPMAARILTEWGVEEMTYPRSPMFRCGNCGKRSFRADEPKWSPCPFCGSML